MSELDRNFGLGLGVNKIDDATPGELMRFTVEACTTRGDPALGRDARHLRADKPGAALGALGVVHEVPVRRGAVDGAILRHGRYHDAVLELQLAQAEGREHRWPRRRGASAGRALLKPSLCAVEPARIALAQVLVADALRSRQQRVVELHGIEIEIALDLFEPCGRVARRALYPDHLRAPLVLVAGERRRYAGLSPQIVGQSDGAFQREFGA